MGQPLKKTVKKTAKIVKVKKKTLPKPIPQQKKKRIHPEYGTSKLEEKFAKEFLDKLGVKYIYQFKMGSIGRYADFYLPEENIMIEVDGDYYHSYGLLFEDMSPMQKKNYRVDRQKDRWAAMNGVVMLRIWEHDINQNPSKVMNILKERISSIKKTINFKNRRQK